jgi:hypothetical protein
MGTGAVRLAENLAALSGSCRNQTMERTGND